MKCNPFRMVRALALFLIFTAAPLSALPCPAPGERRDGAAAAVAAAAACRLSHPPTCNTLAQCSPNSILPS